MPFLLFLGPLLKSPTAWLAIALAISLLGSAGLYKLHIHDIQRIAVLKERNTEAIADAKACSDGVAELRHRGEVRQKFVEEHFKAAREQARELNKKADATLQGHPVGAACDAAMELNLRKTKERRGQ